MTNFNLPSLMYEKALMAVGLSAEQSQIYEILLGLGPTPAKDILKKTTLKRGYVYKLLTELKEKGLVSSNTEGVKTVFTPEPPTFLTNLLAAQIEQTRQAKLTLAGALDNLKSLYNLHQEKPTVRFFEGIEGLKAVLDDSLSAKGPIYTLVDSESITGNALEIDQAYVAKRFKLKIPKKIITPDTPTTRAYYQKNTSPLTEVRLLSMKNPIFGTGLQIYNNTISHTTFSGKKIIGVIIEDAPITAMHRNIFEYLWNSLKPLYDLAPVKPLPAPTSKPAAESEQT